ncbi:HAD family hydrolase [Desulfogranum mediterraneum]|uniref:HAD family hydrolase n=1 Tax=Desulfogranum mediterraneum TaxID=160661 RepID=UPI0004242E41|nr:HAD family hydrolase [Desulfogranum mediterraneum]
MRQVWSIAGGEESSGAGSSGPHRGLFVVDLDGTLLTSQRRLAARDREALERLRVGGYLVAVATGRSNYSFQRLLVQLACLDGEARLPLDYVIFSTGAGIMAYPDSQLLQSFGLHPLEVATISRYLQGLGLDFMVHAPVPETRQFLYHGPAGDNPDFSSRLDQYQDCAAPFSSQALIELGGATEVLCIVPQDRGHEVAAHLGERFSGFSVIKATSPLDGASVWIEIFPPQVSKSRAVQWLARRCRVAAADICAVGNDYNDLDLLRWAESSFMVANGPPALLDLFETVSSNDQGGVAEAAERWLCTRGGG